MPGHFAIDSVIALPMGDPALGVSGRAKYSSRVSGSRTNCSIVAIVTPRRRSGTANPRLTTRHWLWVFELLIELKRPKKPFNNSLNNLLDPQRGKPVFSPFCIANKGVTIKNSRQK
jgi:hypothetical protein